MAEDTSTTETAPPAETPPAAPAEETDDLGDAGKKALAAERTAAKAAEKRAKAAESELEKLRLANASESEKALAAAKAEGRTEALTVANGRLLRAEVKAAAAGVLQDPDDAVSMIDLEQFEIDDDGNVDIKAITAEVQRLAKAKPYLAAGAKPTALPGGGATPSTGQSMDDLIRAAARGRSL